MTAFFSRPNQNTVDIKFNQLFVNDEYVNFDYEFLFLDEVGKRQHNFLHCRAAAWDKTKSISACKKCETCVKFTRLVQNDSKSAKINQHFDKTILNILAETGEAGSNIGFCKANLMKFCSGNFDKAHIKSQNY